MSACPEVIASKDFRAASKQTSSSGTSSRRASSRAMSTVTPAGSSGVPCASTGFPRLMDARNTPDGARSSRTLVIPATLVGGEEAYAEGGDQEFSSGR